MILTVELDEQQEREILRAAAQLGLRPEEYALRLLGVSQNGKRSPSGKTHRAMQLSGVAPSGRSAAEIDAELQSARDEWDSKA